MGYYHWGSDAGSCLLHIFCCQTPLRHLLLSQILNFWSNRDFPWCSRSRKNSPRLKRKGQRRIPDSWLSWFHEEMLWFHGPQCHSDRRQCSPLFCILKKASWFMIVIFSGVHLSEMSTISHFFLILPSRREDKNSPVLISIAISPFSNAHLWLRKVFFSQLSQLISRFFMAPGIGGYQGSDAKT